MHILFTLLCVPDNTLHREAYSLTNISCS